MSEKAKKLEWTTSSNTAYTFSDATTTNPLFNEDPGGLLRVDPSPFAYKPMSTRSPLSRRKTIGDTSPTLDYPGFWIHITNDSAGVPKAIRMLEVDDALSTWKYMDEDEIRPIERAPRIGVFVYLW